MVGSARPRVESHSFNFTPRGDIRHRVAEGVSTSQTTSQPYRPTFTGTPAKFVRGRSSLSVIRSSRCQLSGPIGSGGTRGPVLSGVSTCCALSYLARFDVCARHGHSG